jgi:hypothetical protein
MDRRRHRGVVHVYVNWCSVLQDVFLLRAVPELGIRRCVVVAAVEALMSRLQVNLPFPVFPNLCTLHIRFCMFFFSCLHALYVPRVLLLYASV